MTGKLYLVLAICERESSILCTTADREAARACLKADFLETTGLTNEDLEDEQADDRGSEWDFDEEIAWSNQPHNTNFDWEIFEVDLTTVDKKEEA